METGTCVASAARLSQRLAYVLWLQYALILACSAAAKLGARLMALDRRHNSSARRRQDLRPTLMHRIQAWCKAPLFGQRHAQPVVLLGVELGSMPSGGQALASLLFLAINLMLLAAGHCTNAQSADNTAAVRSVAVRTGLFAFANMPLVVGLAGRNDALSAMTGLSRSTVIYVHRLAGRLVVLLALAHTAAYLYVIGKTSPSPNTSAEASDAAGNMTLLATLLRASVSEPYLIAGTIAACAAVTTLLGAARLVRDRSHELFAWTHAALGVAFIVGSLLHEVYATNSTPVKAWLYLTLALLALDYVARVARTIYNTVSRTSSGERGRRSGAGGRRLQCAQAVLTYVGDGITQVQIDLPLGAGRDRRIKAGDNCYLSFPGLELGAAHPFTVLDARLATLGDSASRERIDVDFAQRPELYSAGGDTTASGSHTDATQHEATVEVRSFHLPLRHAPAVQLGGGGEKGAIVLGQRSLSTQSSSSDLSGSTVTNDLDHDVVSLGKPALAAAASGVRQVHRLTFLIRGRSGLTNVLLRRAQSVFSGVEHPVKCTIDGPFRHSAIADSVFTSRSANVHLVAAGVGVTAALPRLKLACDAMTRSTATSSAHFESGREAASVDAGVDEGERDDDDAPEAVEFTWIVRDCTIITPAILATLQSVLDDVNRHNALLAARHGRQAYLCRPLPDAAAHLELGREEHTVGFTGQMRQKRLRIRILMTAADGGGGVSKALLHAASRCTSGPATLEVVQLGRRPDLARDVLASALRQSGGGNTAVQSNTATGSTALIVSAGAELCDAVRHMATTAEAIAQGVSFYEDCF